MSPRTHGLRTAWRWLPLLIWMGVIFWLSSLSSPGPEGIEIPDKVAHFGEYGVLGALLWWALAPVGRRRAAGLTVVIGALYAASDEAHQHFVPARTADLMDWATDCAAVIVVGALGSIVRVARRADARRESRD